MNKDNRTPSKKQEDIDFGDVAADEIHSIIQKRISNKTANVIRFKKGMLGWSAKKDQENGDIFIEKQNGNTIKADVKRGRRNGEVFISYISATEFKGDGFILTPYDMDPLKTWYVPAHSIKAYINKVASSGNLIILEGSNAQGHYFKPSTMYRSQKFMSWLDDI